MKLSLTVFGLTFSIQHAWVRRITPVGDPFVVQSQLWRIRSTCRVFSAAILSGVLTMFSAHEEDGFT